MSKKRLDIPDDLTSRLVGQPVSYPTPSVYPPVSVPVQIPVPVPVPEYTPVAEAAPINKGVGGRPVKATSVGRVKYTTAISKDLIRFLRVEAAQRDMTPADLLEIIISEYQNRG
jgi:hypothetical protein